MPLAMSAWKHPKYWPSDPFTPPNPYTNTKFEIQTWNTNTSCAWVVASWPKHATHQLTPVTLPTRSKKPRDADWRPNSREISTTSLGTTWWSNFGTMLGTTLQTTRGQFGDNLETIYQTPEISTTTLATTRQWSKQVTRAPWFYDRWASIAAPVPRAVLVLVLM